MKTCPFCAEEIQDAAIVCKHCGRDLEPQAAPAIVPAPAQPQDNRKIILWSSLGIIAGSLLPWATVSTGLFSKTLWGYEAGDGIILAVVGLVILLASRAKNGSIIALVVALLGSIFTLIIGSTKVSALNSLSAGNADTTIGFGLILLLLSAFAAVIGVAVIGLAKVAPTPEHAA